MKPFHTQPRGGEPRPLVPIITYTLGHPICNTPPQFMNLLVIAMPHERRQMHIMTLVCFFQRARCYHYCILSNIREYCCHAVCVEVFAKCVNICLSTGKTF